MDWNATDDSDISDDEFLAELDIFISKMRADLMRSQQLLIELSEIEVSKELDSVELRIKGSIRIIDVEASCSFGNIDAAIRTNIQTFELQSKLPTNIANEINSETNLGFLANIESDDDQLNKTVVEDFLGGKTVAMAKTSTQRKKTRSNVKFDTNRTELFVDVDDTLMNESTLLGFSMVDLPRDNLTRQKDILEIQFDDDTEKSTLFPNRGYLKFDRDEDLLDSERDDKLLSYRGPDVSLQPIDIFPTILVIKVFSDQSDRKSIGREY